MTDVGGASAGPGTVVETTQDSQSGTFACAGIRLGSHVLLVRGHLDLGIDVGLESFTATVKQVSNATIATTTGISSRKDTFTGTGFIGDLSAGFVF